MVTVSKRPFGRNYNPIAVLQHMNEQFSRSYSCNFEPAVMTEVYDINIRRCLLLSKLRSSTVACMNTWIGQAPIQRTAAHNAAIQMLLPRTAPNLGAVLAFFRDSTVLVGVEVGMEPLAGSSRYWPGVELCAADGAAARLPFKLTV